MRGHDGSVLAAVRAQVKADTMLSGEITRLNPCGKAIVRGGTHITSGTRDVQAGIMLSVERNAQRLIAGIFLAGIQANAHALRKRGIMPCKERALDTGFETGIPDYGTRQLHLRGQR